MPAKKGQRPWNKGLKHYRAGIPRSEETKRKISEGLRSNKNGFGNKSRTGLTPWNKGKTMSKDFCRKSSEAHKGIPSPMKGKKHSEEAKRKMSEAHKGKNISIETRKKISTSLKKIGHSPPSTKGVKRTNESNYKISHSLMGHSVSDETREKLRKARLKQVISKKDTSIEIALQKRLDALGIKYMRHLPICGICQPDIVFPEKKVAVFADGDYWHSKEFKNGIVWKRDKHINNTLNENGWDVLRFWGSEIRESLDGCVEEVLCKIL